MEWHKRFFLQPRLTSKLKHLLLQSYVKEFAYHLGSARPVVYYVDGFAGAGSYQTNDHSEDGSPLLIARLAQQLKSSARGIDLRCINVEQNPGRFRSLEAATGQFRPDIVVANYRGAFADVLPEIVQRIAGAPAFFFIDPFGTKGIAFSKLRPIFRRRNTTEVLITLHTDGIAKKSGWFAREDDRNPRARNVAGKLTGNLAEALDAPLNELREAWRETAGSGDTAAFEKRALDYYLKKLRHAGFKFTKAFRVLYYNAGTLREAPVCFHLVFGTRHEKGLFEMNDAMVEALGKFYREVYSDTFFPEFEAEREKLVGAEAVRREIENAFRSKSFSIDDVKRHCMQRTDYLIKGSEYRQLIFTMAREGGLRRITGGPISNETTQFELAESAPNRGVDRT
jgi:three-Cys-motif partner protein